jgi:NTP pyrophosphatase (non-canonical NTP hydrolase)
MGIKMKVKEWHKWVEDNATEKLDLPYAVIALNEEAGEVAGWYKKAILRENKVGLTEEDLAYELGDVLYYLTRIANLKGWTLKDLMNYNVQKLTRRKEKGYKQIV